MKNYLGIDYGSKRVGVAIGDAELKMARPLEIVVNDEGLLDRIKTLAVDHEAGVLVVGLPRGLDGQETKYTGIVRAFATQLEKLGLPVELQDEALTSELVGSNSAFPADDRAAAMILQDHLDNL
ncbi:MAG TPA: Holliday junction resolvase RuvX [Candidatus Nanoarchaeia archaeon]|nr:Holliday junction resolvase RuvX [Candidatus Nanoarchaeia archaeon]